MSVEVSTTSSSWLNSTEIWLFSIKKDTYTVALRDCPSIKVKVRVGHITPVDKPLIRRCILFAEDDMLNTTLSSKQSPALLLISNSCNFKFDNDAVKGLFSTGNESWAMLLWSFTVVPGATFNGRPDHCNAIDLPGMPVCELNSCHSGSSIFADCNNSTNTSTSTMSIHNQHSDSSSESDKDDQKGNDNDNDELYAISIQIRGSTYEEIYQQNLKDAQSALGKQQDLQVRLLPETDNPKDKNAISVYITVNSKDLKLGYIGVLKIPKVSAAIKSGEIVKTSVKCVNSWYIQNLNCRKLKGHIIVCKKGTWYPDSDNNVYHADL